jgi:hypothetical protein
LPICIYCVQLKIIQPQRIQNIGPKSSDVIFAGS